MIRIVQPGCERLRVLQVILTRGFAGSERAAAETCNALARGNDVAIALRRDHRSRAGASIRDYLEPGVTVFELPAHWRTRAALHDVIEGWGPDIVHTHLRRGTRYVAQLNDGVPHVATLHIDLNGAHYLEADALCCISPWQVTKVLRSGYRGAVCEIPNSLVPQPRLAESRRVALRNTVGAGLGDFVIGGVGRLTSDKGFDLLIEAFRRASLPATRLVIVGEGRARARLERLAHGLPVSFTGFRNDAKDWFQAFDLFVSPSRKEPFGRVIIEALDAGTPVLATEADGPRDIATHYPVALVPCDDAPALATALRRAHGRPRLRVAAQLDEFHVERVTGSLLALYRRCLPAVEPRVARAAA